nr:protein rot1 [Quercus suber]
MRRDKMVHSCIHQALIRRWCFSFEEDVAVVHSDEEYLLCVKLSWRQSKGFYDPKNERLIEPSHPGISYSFTNNGWYEEAYYRAIANPQDPSCPGGIMQWQHGKWQFLANGSLILEPVSIDGRQLMSEPCKYKNSVYTRYNQSELFQRYSVYLDPYHNIPRLDLYQFNGAPLQPMYLVMNPPQMLPTSTLHSASTASASATGKSKRGLDREIPLGWHTKLGVQDGETHIVQHIDADRVWWIGLAMTGLGAKFTGNNISLSRFAEPQSQDKISLTDLVIGCVLTKLRTPDCRMSQTQITSAADHSETWPGMNVSTAKSHSNSDEVEAGAQAHSCPAIMALQMNHSTKVDALSRQTQEHAAELVGMKQAFRADLWNLQYQLEDLKTHVAAIAELAGGRQTNDTTDVKEKWKPVGLDHEKDSTKNGFKAAKHGDAALENVACSLAPEASSWMPLAVRQMPKTAVPDQSHNTQTFAWEHIRLTLGGEQWSPGFYFVSKDSVLPSKSYWILEGEYEPYLPRAPGQHGAKLTAFFNYTGCADIDGFPDETNYLRAPVFIRAPGRREYIYYGEYSQLRFSDKLDYDRMMDGTVPANVRRYWAEQLAAQGRPAWVTNALMAHFWPQPTYHGGIPGPGAGAEAAADDQRSQDGDKAASESLAAHGRLLREWQATARVKASLLSSAALLDAFAAADADEEPGLRLWWEYLQCVGYDQGFYDMMVQLKDLGSAGGSTKSSATLRNRKP